MGKGRVGADTYKSTLISSFFAPSCSYHLAQQARVHLRGRLEHLLRTLTQHFRVAIEAREVQAHEQRAGLNIVDAVGEEVGDGVGDFLRLDGGGWLLSGGPEAAEEVFDIDYGWGVGGACGGFYEVGLGGGWEGGEGGVCGGGGHVGLG